MSLVYICCSKSDQSEGINIRFVLILAVGLMPVARMRMEKSDKRIAFFEQRLFRPASWALRRERQGCTIEDAAEFYVSTDRAPPPLRDQPPPPAPPKPEAPKPPPKSLAERLRDWMNEPPESAPPPAPAKPKVRKPRVKPFDLQDIPIAMDRIGWPMSAKVMRKWFSGELNYANTDLGATKGINQGGEPFPASMIDTTMFTMEWILSFSRARNKYDELVGKIIFSQDSKKAIKGILARYEPSPYYFDAWEICGGDFGGYHREFQFQLNRVDAENKDKFLMFIRGAVLPNGVLMDDLYGALGAFSLYAALDGFYYKKIGPARVRLIIMSISIYMKDVFTFHDRSDKTVGVIPNGTQYLGHWNKTGFIIIPFDTVVGEVSKADWLMSPVARWGMVSSDMVYYPVRNKDYRAWQLKHRQGGDLIIYSDRRILRFRDPWVMDFNL
ncbi:DUF6402 family protein [Cupriavidus sp. 30B13]|uniref:DUF6402 family protein n=1 Tax=Cupriavidus sp. 30B13 TaxID=3384241 RepID=UPI003B90D95F